eukprot:Nk52_evm27s295 gene=Nk52_evmTU27s295
MGCSTSKAQELPVTMEASENDVEGKEVREPPSSCSNEPQLKKAKSIRTIAQEKHVNELKSEGWESADQEILGVIYSKSSSAIKSETQMKSDSVCTDEEPEYIPGDKDKEKPDFEVQEQIMTVEFIGENQETEKGKPVGELDKSKEDVSSVENELQDAEEKRLESKVSNLLQVSEEHNARRRRSSMSKEEQATFLKEYSDSNVSKSPIQVDPYSQIKV